MRIAVLSTFLLLLLLCSFDCGGEGTFAILFTGDDRGWLTPAG